MANYIRPHSVQQTLSICWGIILIHHLGKKNMAQRQLKLPNAVNSCKLTIFLLRLTWLQNMEYIINAAANSHITMQHTACDMIIKAATPYLGFPWCDATEEYHGIKIEQLWTTLYRLAMSQNLWRMRFNRLYSSRSQFRIKQGLGGRALKPVFQILPKHATRVADAHNHPSLAHLLQCE